MKLKLFIVIICWLALMPAKAQLIDFSTLERDSVTDIDGNTYPTIRFGDTWWMATNLRTKHFNDGTAITQATSYINASDTKNDWEWWSHSKRWAYINLDSANTNLYGLGYTWFAATDSLHGCLCPTGWSLPDTTYWFELGRLIVGKNTIKSEIVTRNTPQGGTETVNEPILAIGLGQYLKSDNGRIVGYNKYGDTTWLSGGYWPHNDTLSNYCNASGMNILPSGAVGVDNGNFGKEAYYWTPNYVHSDHSGQGRRASYFTYENHDLGIAWFHNANMASIRCIKAANKLNLSATTIGLTNIESATDSSVTVTSNSVWTASTKASWLAVSQTVSKGNGIIVIKTITANSGKDSRTDTIWVTMDEVKKQKILVTQAGTNLLFSVADTSLCLSGNDGNIVNFAISATASWAITTPVDWLSANPTVGSGNTSVTLTATKNATGNQRRTYITVSCPDLDSTILIAVNQIVAITTSVAAAITKAFELYPNPASDYLQIIGATGMYTIFSITGNRLKTGMLQNGVNQISISELKPGIYFFQAGTVIKRWIKQ